MHSFASNAKPQVGFMNAYNSLSIEPKCLYFPDFLLHSVQGLQSLSCHLPLNLCHWLYTLIIINTVPLQVFTKKSKEDKICTLSCYNLWYAIFINAMFMLSLIWIFFHFLSSHKCKEERYTQTKFCIPVVQNIYISKIPFKCVWSVQDKKNTP